MKIAPSEYWKMSPVEMMVILEPDEKPNTLTDDQIDELEQTRQKLEAEGHLVL